MNPDHDWPGGPDPALSTVDGPPAWVADALDASSTQDWYDVDDDRERHNVVWSAFVRDVEATLEPADRRRVLRTGRLAMRGHLDGEDS